MPDVSSKVNVNFNAAVCYAEMLWELPGDVDDISSESPLYLLL